jgi:arylsulfatase A-like enzyme
MKAGIQFGVSVWAAYAAAEMVMLLLAPLVSGQNHIVLRSHWWFLAALVPAYLIVGGLLGGIASWVWEKGRARPAAEDPQRLAVLALTAAYLANLAPAIGSWHDSDRLAVILALGVAAGAGCGLFWPRCRAATRFFVQPWAAGALLAAGPALASESRLAGVVALGAMLLFSYWMYWMVRSRHIAPSWRQLVAAVLVLLALPAAARLVTEIHEPDSSFVPGEAASPRPHVILIVLDTVRADHLSLYGYMRRTTPWLERFARTATVYRNAFAASYNTLASHSSMFTGLYPRTHGATNLPPGLSVGEPLDPRFETLAERLASLGYFNAAVVANFSYLGSEFGTDQGFHIYDDRQPVPCFPRGRRFALRYGLLSLAGGALDGAQRLYRSASEINETVFELLDAFAEVRSPLFLFINYMDAHSPYVPPPPFNRLFDGRQKGLTPVAHYNALRDDVALRKRTISEVERRHYVSQYDGAIAFLDAELERLVARLRERGLYDESLIIITSDHGEAFGEHGYVGHEWSMHQHQIGVPLIIKYPRQTVGQIVDWNAAHVDLLPTILDAVGAPALEDTPGTSLCDLDAERAARSLYAEGYLKASLVLSDRIRYPLMTWAIVAPDRRKLISDSEGRLELYDLGTDPREERNLAAEQPEASKALLTALEDFKRTHPLAKSAQRRIDPRAMERLRALGYVR